MKRRSSRRKALRYVWHGLAKVGETAFFLLLLPLILIGALLPDRSASTAQNSVKPTPGQTARPRT